MTSSLDPQMQKSSQAHLIASEASRLQEDAPLPVPAPDRPTKAQALQALNWIYNHPKADAVTERTALERFIEQAASGGASAQVQGDGK